MRDGGLIGIPRCRCRRYAGPHQGSRGAQAGAMRRRTMLSLAALTAAAPWPALAVPSAPPARRLDLTNAHTGESFKGPYRDDNGPLAGALKDLSYLLRDFHCGEEIAIDVGVLDFLANVLDAVGATRAI